MPRPIVAPLVSAFVVTIFVVFSALALRGGPFSSSWAGTPTTTMQAVADQSPATSTSSTDEPTTTGTAPPTTDAPRADAEAPTTATADVVRPVLSPAERHARSQAIAAALFEDLNARRSDAGLRPLRWDERLAGTASSWTTHIAAEGDLVHQDLGGDLGFATALGENLARGSSSLSATGIDDAWMASASHRDNMLGVTWDAVGIAVSCTADGQVYATQEFGRVGGATPPGARGLPATGATDPRTTCG